MRKEQIKTPATIEESIELAFSEIRKALSNTKGFAIIALSNVDGTDLTVSLGTGELSISGLAKFATNALKLGRDLIQFDGVRIEGLDNIGVELAETCICPSCSAKRHAAESQNTSSENHKFH